MFVISNAFVSLARASVITRRAAITSREPLPPGPRRPLEYRQLRWSWLLCQRGSPRPTRPAQLTLQNVLGLAPDQDQSSGPATGATRVLVEFVMSVTRGTPPGTPHNAGAREGDRGVTVTQAEVAPLSNPSAKICPPQLVRTSRPARSSATKT